MGKAAHDAYPVARQTFAEADEALSFSLSELCFGGSEEELARTENTQPAILTVSVALHRVLAERGVEAEWMAGHSLGEYSALVAAGSLELASAVRLVRRRGRYMQEAVPEGAGAMAALLGLEDEAVEEVCAEVRQSGVGTVEPANFNSPGQVVIAGARAAVERAVESAKSRGARRALLLNVSAPFHCSLMEPAGERLAAELASSHFADPAVPVICNVDAVPLADAEQVRTALRRQVTSPVRWVDNMRAMASRGATIFVEIGPGKVLSGLAKRCLDHSITRAVIEPVDVDAALAALASAPPDQQASQSEGQQRSSP